MKCLNGARATVAVHLTVEVSLEDTPTSTPMCDIAELVRNRASDRISRLSEAHADIYVSHVSEDIRVVIDAKDTT